MTKTDAHLVSELLGLSKSDLPVEVRNTAHQAAKRIVELVADHEQLIRQGSDHS